MNPDSSPNNQITDGAEIYSELPLAVTSISPQKRNSDRFSLFHKKQFLVGVSSQTLSEFSLQQGTFLTKELFNKLIASEELRSAKERAYRLLARREHGTEELRRKLLRKDLDPGVVDEVITQCREKKLLDDYAYASSFSQDKFQLRNWGPHKIKSSLFSKGVPRDIISNVISELKENIDPVQTCLELAVKRRRHFLREPDEFKRKQKIFRYLAGKGYSSDTIKKAMPKILEQLNA